MCEVKPIYMECCHTNFVISLPKSYKKFMCGLKRLYMETCRTNCVHQ